ncbi:MAG: DUF4136 domain-containing protein [Flavobacteriaceae bacterium]|nr:DUF4136 domain-containing protein [Flavobacteriaceae bacterium]
MKKVTQTISALLLFIVVSSCSSVRVATDYDSKADFNQYKTFAFFKTGIDKAEISDLDKRRILRAIESELLAKGYSKSETPDILVSIFTKSSERVNVYNNAWGMGGWGWGGWGPWGWGFNQQPMVTTSTQGTLYIDLIDANKKELIWQGMGTGYLAQGREKKEARIKEFVAKVMAKYPPGSEQ